MLLSIAAATIQMERMPPPLGQRVTRDATCGGTVTGAIQGLAIRAWHDTINSE